MALTKVPEVMLQNEKTYLTSNVQRFTAGSGTYYLAYWFVCSSASATISATYTNNSQTFTVLRTIASANLVLMRGTGTPSSSGTLTKASGTGDSTIVFSSYRAPLELVVQMVGGGGEGGGSGSGAGSAGGSTTFGSSLLTATGGNGGASGSSGGGAGGTATITSPAIMIVSADGSPGESSGNGAGNSQLSGGGGDSYFGGAGSSRANTTAGGIAGATNSGSGGSGQPSTGGATTGAGGGAGGYAEALIPSPLASYPYAVGTGGSSGGGGGNGGSGIIIVFEKYQ